jgi:hypothetical protein
MFLGSSIQEIIGFLSLELQENLSPRRLRAFCTITTLAGMRLLFERLTSVKLFRVWCSCRGPCVCMLDDVVFGRSSLQYRFV